MKDMIKYLITAGSLIPLLSSFIVGCGEAEKTKPSSSPALQQPQTTVNSVVNETTNQTQGVIKVKTGWSTFTAKDGLFDPWVSSLVQDNQGTIWVGTGSGLFTFNGSAWVNYSGPTKIPAVGPAAKDNSGNLWFGTNTGPYEFTGKQWITSSDVYFGLPGTVVKNIFVDNTGNIWFATVKLGTRPPIDQGVTRYDGKQWKTFPLGDVQSIFQDSYGNMWFGTNVGVVRYDNVSFTTFTTKDGLVDNDVWSIGQDNQGNMWFGTWNSGTSRFDGKTWQTFYPADGLISDAVHSMLKDKQGNLWLGAYSSHGYYGVSKFDGKNFQNFDPFNNGSSENPYAINSILEDDAGNIWFATNIGIARYTPS